MKFCIAFFLAFTLSAFAGNTDPLWSLKEVAELSELLQQAQGRDRFGFLELLDDSDADDDDEAEDDDSTSSSTESSSSSKSTASVLTTKESASDSTSANRRKGKSPNMRTGGGPGGRGGMPPGFKSLDNADDTKWFNAQAFVRWFVRGLASLYEGLVNLMLLPLKILISFIDV